MEIESNGGLDEIQLAIRSLLGKEHLPWQHKRDKQIRRYDLRDLIHDLWIEDWSGTLCTLGMRLRADSVGAGRPEQVAAALGFSGEPQAIHRTKLLLVR
jgi:hypothetical protein